MALRLAILLLLPGLALAQGDAERGRLQVRSCVACHSRDGGTPQPAWPKLGGQREAYLAQQLVDFRKGLRRNQYMDETAHFLSDQHLHDLAAWYATRDLTSVPGAEGDEQGQELFTAGDDERDIPACAVCHGEDALGGGEGAPGGIPSLAGQHREFTSRALNALATGNRDNDYLDMMGHIASRLEPEDVEHVSSHLESLP